MLGSALCGRQGEEVVWIPDGAAMLFAAAPLPAEDLPRLESRDGRHALTVDGAPFLVLGAQVNNSSAWPAIIQGMADGEPAARQIGQVSIAWEQIEPDGRKLTSPSSTSPLRTAPMPSPWSE